MDRAVVLAGLHGVLQVSDGDFVEFECGDFVWAAGRGAFECVRAHRFDCRRNGGGCATDQTGAQKFAPSGSEGTLSARAILFAGRSLGYRLFWSAFRILLHRKVSARSRSRKLCRPIVSQTGLQRHVFERYLQAGSAAIVTILSDCWTVVLWRSSAGFVFVGDLPSIACAGPLGALAATRPADQWGASHGGHAGQENADGTNRSGGTTHKRRGPSTTAIASR